MIRNGQDTWRQGSVFERLDAMQTRWRAAVARMRGKPEFGEMVAQASILDDLAAEMRRRLAGRTSKATQEAAALGLLIGQAESTLLWTPITGGRARAAQGLREGPRVNRQKNLDEVADLSSLVKCEEGAGLSFSKACAKVSREKGKRRGRFRISARKISELVREFRKKI